MESEVLQFWVAISEGSHSALQAKKACVRPAVLDLHVARNLASPYTRSFSCRLRLDPSRPLPLRTLTVRVKTSEGFVKASGGRECTAAQPICALVVGLSTPAKRQAGEPDKSG